jgi:serine/threonine-protein kinase
VVAGTYRIVRHIGSGGSSHVFEAEHLRLGKRFAVKLLRPELDANRRTAQRFRREARAIARLKSEHIVSVVDCGELDDGTPYLVMELLEGEDLRSLLNREGALPARRAEPLIEEACRGLADVNSAGMVHRDLKPENLFITKRSSGEDWCKVLDFGVAKMETSMATADNAILGTARYMAPEQLTDSAAVGVATDVYALGAILYECLAGRALVRGSTVQEVMYRIMNANPQPLSELVPSLSPELGNVIERCLRKTPAARPESIGELAALLQSAVKFATERRPTTDTIREDDDLRPPSPRRGALPLRAAAAIVALLMTAFAGWSLRGSSIAATSRVSPAVAVAPAPAPIATTTLFVDGPPAPTPPPVASTSSPAPSSSIPRRTPVSRRPASVSPHGSNSARAATAATNRFDSINPYTE